MAKTKTKKKTEDEQMFTFDEYMEFYAQKKDKEDIVGDDAEEVARAMANDTIAILDASMEEA